MSDRTRHLVLGTAGHIDHGKTALVRALTGVDTDRLPAEKQRGITIDLGFAALSLGTNRLSIIDVPGHERFIRNMLAGATGLDLAMLVVAADDSVMPQTREHLEILRLLGLSGGLVVLTKCDLADPTWVEMVEDDVRQLTRETFLAGARIVRTSVVTGQGISEVTRILEALCDAAPGRDDAGLFRMAIDRSFTVAGHGTVVTGTVASGHVAVGEELELQPAGRSVRVRGLHQHDRPVESVGRGSRAAINLAGVRHDEVIRGFELASPGYLRATQILTVEVIASREAPRPLRHRGRYKLHLGTAEVSAVLSLLEIGEVDPAAPRLAQLFTSHPVVSVQSQPFVLREESPSATIAGGRVIQPSARRYRRLTRPGIERLATLQSTDPIERLAGVLGFLGFEFASDQWLCALAGLDESGVRQGMAALAAGNRLVEIPIGPRRTVRIATDHALDLEDRLLRALGRLHAARPRQSAIPRTHLAAELPDLASETLVAALVDRLVARGAVVADRRAVAIRGHEPKLSQGERKLKNELAESIRRGGITPPDLGELTAAAGARSGAVPDLLALLCDENRLVRISPQLFLDVEIEAEIVRRVGNHLAGGQSVTMSELRDLLGTTRKFAVPLGEYFDRIGLTIREGDVRRLGPNASRDQ
jgi:selenocysteine-specific elongation factor